MNSNELLPEALQGSSLKLKDNPSATKTLFIESYGCQMNFSDSEIVASILQNEGYTTTTQAGSADLILVNTCAIRDNAEIRVRQRLQDYKKIKSKSDKPVLIGVLGCMAERLKKQFLEEERLVDVVVGPDAYRDLPRLLHEAESGRQSINVLLSKEETYADIAPLRLDQNGVSGFVSIMRGCDNMCSFCVVPFTRGRERSRDPQSILQECEDAYNQGYREITLLGQNVDSYKFSSNTGIALFSDLLKLIAEHLPNLWIRFSTSHPKDMTDDVLQVMALYPNICKYIHLPVQSGSDSVLERMNRGYTSAWYLNRIKAIRHFIPDCGISTDIITGFCGENPSDHQETLQLMKTVNFDFAYMFMYSERPKTLAERKYTDDVPETEKHIRLQEVIALQREHSKNALQKYVGTNQWVLIEGDSKKSNAFWMGRNSQNAVVIFPKLDEKKGDRVNVSITSSTYTALLGNRIL